VIKNNLTTHCYFIILNIVMLWLVVVFTMFEGEDTHNKLDEHISEVNSLVVSQNKGKRNTYCDQLFHLVSDHDYPESILDECWSKPRTDLQNTIPKWRE